MIEVVFEFGRGETGFRDGRFVIREGCDFYQLDALFKSGRCDALKAEDSEIASAICRMTDPARNIVNLRLFFDRTVMERDREHWQRRQAREAVAARGAA